MFVSLFEQAAQHPVSLVTGIARPVSYRCSPTPEDNLEHRLDILDVLHAIFLQDSQHSM